MPDPEITERENALLRAYLLERLQAGVDSRCLMHVQAQLLGMMAATCSAPGCLDLTLALITSAIRYNAILNQPVAGHA